MRVNNNPAARRRPRARSSGRKLIISVVFATVVVSLICAFVLVDHQHPGLGTAILLLGIAGGISVGVSYDRRKALKMIPAVPLPLPQGGRPVPHSTQDTERLIADAASAFGRARIPDTARRPGGRPADAVFVPPSRGVVTFLGMAILFTAATVWVGLVSLEWLPAMGLVSIGLIALASAASFRVMTCSSTAVYDRTRPGTGHDLQLDEIDGIGIVIGNDPQRWPGLVLRAGRRWISVPRQVVNNPEFQPLVARLVQCDAPISPRAQAALLSALRAAETHTDQGAS